MVKTLINLNVSIPNEYAEDYTNIELGALLIKILKYGINYEIGVSKDDIYIYWRF